MFFLLDLTNYLKGLMKLKEAKPTVDFKFLTGFPF